MIELLLAAFGLALAGFDPAGALVATGALGGGARERHVIVFGLVSLLGTVVLGTALSLTVGPYIANIDWSALIPGDQTAALVEAGLGAALVAWAIMRARKPAARTPAPKPRSHRGTGPIALVAVGALFALGAILDPTFVSLVVIAGRNGTFLSVVFAHSVWVLVSQSPLVLIVLAIAAGKHDRAVAWFQSRWEEIRPSIGRLITGALLSIGALLLLDAGWWFATGKFLLPG